ncbi:hypothetical protein B0A48_18601 [Cryoendolithus antarcticus]|uniref:Uncharacterized protein n=1 Tax=Cryoendolithus antarcticus TaxID=1507870 RepID=A0A1V8S8H5_9PEZI|nr:hypothetical protein B0A48_18601 [Cryoendolithus antarcticus]
MDNEILPPPVRMADNGPQRGFLDASQLGSAAAQLGQCVVDVDAAGLHSLPLLRLPLLYLPLMLYLAADTVFRPRRLESQHAVLIDADLAGLCLLGHGGERVGA